MYSLYIKLISLIFHFNVLIRSVCIYCNACNNIFIVEYFFFYMKDNYFTVKISVSLKYKNIFATQQREV